MTRTQEKIFELEEGIEAIIGKINTQIGELEYRPLLISIYGGMNSGKSYIIDKVGLHFEKEGLRIYQGQGAPSPSFFEHMQSYQKSRDVNICLFHYCGSRSEMKEDPNSLAKALLGRDLNLNVGIYNPNHGKNWNDEYVTGEFDIVIRNPNSKVKKWGRKTKGSKNKTK